jgi:tetratricopeptide (TPR) repeat protein
VRPSSLVSILLLTLSLLAARRADAETPKAFAQRISAAIQLGDSTMLDRAIDVDGMLDRACSGLGLSAANRRDFDAGVKKSFSFGARIVEESEGPIRYQLLRVRPVQGKQRALFRLISPAGVNYHDLELAPAKDGKSQRVVDIFIFMSGEWVTQSWRRGCLTVAAHEQSAALDRMTPAQRAFIENLPKITELSTAASSKDHARALAIYRALPPAAQTERNVMMLYYGAASIAGGDEYARALDAVKKAFPGDPSLDLLLFDDYFLKKQYDGALAAIGRVRRALGGDAYLDFLEGNVLYAKGDHAAAKVRLNRAIATEPALVEPYWTLITISLEQRTHDETARLLERVEVTAKVELQDVASVAEYAEFAKSKAYAQWKQRWQARQKTRN